MRVLVTGGSGFLGGYVIPALTSRGYDVVALARRPAAAERVTELGAQPIEGDLDDPAAVDHAFKSADVDALVNLASLGFGHAPAIVAATEEAGIRRAIFVSTTAIFTTLNAPSKKIRVAAEATITESALDWTIVRPTMIYGDAGDRNMTRLLAAIRRLPVIPVPGGGSRLQQPVHVADLAEAIATCLDRPASIGRTYDLAGPEPLTFREVVAEAGRAVGRPPRIMPIPLRPSIAAVRIYERIAARPRLKVEQLERLAEDKAFDIAEAARDLGYAPRAFVDGIATEAAVSWTG